MCTTWPEFDGLQASSTMTGRLIVVLWSAADDSLPETAVFSRALARAAAKEVGYHIV
ncbi:hypothetical protein [Mycobacterium sp.]